MSDWIDQTERLARFVDKAPTTIGLDTEFMRISTFLPKLALVQVEIDGQAALIDPVAIDDPTPLAAVLGDRSRTVVMHSASEDIEALATWKCTLATLFDTQIAAAFAGLGAGLGYQKLVAELLGVELAKGETRSDWLQRPLSPKQLDYAAQDVVHLPALHAELSARLERRGFLEWFQHDCARLLERNRESDPEPQQALRGAADWERPAQALLRRVLLWREQTIRLIDRPRPWLLDDAHALDLCFRPPLDAGELEQRTRGLRALRSPQRAELLELLQRPLAAGEMEFAPIPHPPSPRDRALVAALKEVVVERARHLDLPDGLLCARRHLESLLATRRWPSALDGWRREVLHDALMARLPDAA